MVSCGSQWIFTISNFLISFIVVSCHASCTNYQHCEFHPGHELDCFSSWGTTGKKAWRCQWQPGISTSKKTYTLIIQQESYCLTKNNITGQNKGIEIFERKNMTALVVENPDSQNCTKAIFKGTPKNLLRCGPPVWSSFYRHSGILDVTVVWPRHENKLIMDYAVRYKAMGEELWKILSKADKTGSRVNGLNPHLIYMVQIKCSQNMKCSQCVWSDSYIIPPELKTQPNLIRLEKVDHPNAKGTRLVSLTWKTVETERPDGYSVSIQKASGEPASERFNTSAAEITLHLSCSAYIVHISAFNNVSASPALSQTIQSCEGVTSLDAGRLNVTVHNNISFTVSWDAQLLNDYVCYSVEWSQKNQNKTAHFSFFEDAQSNRTVDLTEPLERYKRYTLSLHARVTKETCNLKHINSSESTFGSVHFYFMEGSPISAPTNISYYSVSSSSLVLQWSPIPEEDLRGFLLGYVIYYKEYNRDANTTEKVVSVDAELTSFVIEDLKPSTGYHAQISGFTRAGTGERSITVFFKTFKQVYSNSVIIIVFVATIALLIVMCPILKRTKAIFWPSIPNPEISNAIQNIEKSCEIELLGSLQTLKVEEWHTNGLQFIEEQTALCVSLPNLFAAEKKEDFCLMVSEELQEEVQEELQEEVQEELQEEVQEELQEEVQEELQEEVQEELQEDMIKGITLDQPAHLELKTLSNPQTAFTSGYTTLEMFQQTVTFQCSPTISRDTRNKMQDDIVENKPVLDYVGQFCSSPTFDLSTRL